MRDFASINIQILNFVHFTKMSDLKRLEALENAIASEQLRLAVAKNDGFTMLEAIIAQRKHRSLKTKSATYTNRESDLFKIRKLL